MGCKWDTGEASQCVAPDPATCFLVTDSGEPHCSITNDSVCKGTGLC